MSDTTADPPGRRRVVVCGGSIAALETLGALRSLAGDRVELTLLTPDRSFTLRPLSLDAAFRKPERSPVPMRDLTDRLDVALITDRLAWVDATASSVHTRAGHTVAYDDLVLAIGARPRVAFAPALTLRPDSTEALAELTALVRARRGMRIVAVVPERSGWLLALYETVLALATVDRGPALTLVTVEASPLGDFGEQASAQVGALLSERGVTVVCGARCEVPAPGRAIAHPGEDWEQVLPADRVIALPHLQGPFLRGVACDDRGFIPIDRYCRVTGHGDIHAVGDVTAYPVKHGGLAAQQADVAARDIAAHAGCKVDREPFRPHLEGRLSTGDRPLYMGAHLIGGQPFESVASDAIELATGPKVIAHELDRVLDLSSGSEPGVEHGG